MDSIVDKINKKGAEINRSKEEKLMFQRGAVIADLERVRSLGPRIANLWTICQALLDNGFVLGKVTRSNMGFHYPEFEADGIYHGLGFKVRNRPFGSLTGGTIISFGIEGGGYSGESFFVNKDGVWGRQSENGFVEGNIDLIHFYYDGYRNVPQYTITSFTGKIKQVLEKFDQFEARVLEYAKSIAE